MDRRLFLKTGLASLALSAVPDMATAVSASSDKLPKMKLPSKEDAFRLGMAGYTFVKFDIDTKEIYIAHDGIRVEIRIEADHGNIN